MNSFKEKCSLIKSEDVRLEIPYAFSINLAENRGVMKSIDSYMDIFERIKKLGVKFVFYPELSNLNRRLHYHGWIWFCDYDAVMAFYNLCGNVLQRQSSFKMRVISDYEWHRYCVKNRHITKPYMLSKKLPYKVHYKNPISGTCFIAAIEQFTGQLDE